MTARARTSCFERVRASAGVLGIAAVLSGLGTFADRAEGRDSGGRPSLVIRSQGLPSAVQIAPGDRIERTFELRQRGSTAAVFLKLGFRQRSRLDSDRRFGLQLAIDRCSRPWRKVGGSPSYSCRGKRCVVLKPAPLEWRRRLARLLLRRGAKNYLRLTLTLPTGADNSFQGRTTRLVYTFLAVAGRG